MVNYPIQDFANEVRAFVIRMYSEFIPPLLAVGFCSFVIAALWCAFRRTYSTGLAIASAAWIGVLCRLGVLILVDISSFPAVFPLYINYAYPLACYASLLSIFVAICVVMKRPSATEPVYASQVAFATSAR